MTNGERARKVLEEDAVRIYDEQRDEYRSSCWQELNESARREYIEEAIALALDEAEARGRGTIGVISTNNTNVAIKDEWYLTLKPGQSVAIVEAKP